MNELLPKPITKMQQFLDKLHASFKQITSFLFQGHAHFSKEAAKIHQASMALKEHKKFSIANGLSFRLSLQQTLDENQKMQRPNGILFMGDINNLYEANQYRGEHTTDTLLQSMIDQIRTILGNTSSFYLLGKENNRSDELYWYLPDATNNQELLELFNRLQASPLSISVGSTTDFSQGVEGAIKIAEKNMMQIKEAYKIEQLHQTYGDNYNDLVHFVILQRLQKARIPITKLSKTQRSTLFDTYHSILANLSVEKIVETVKNNLTLSSNPEETVEKEPSISSLLEQAYTELKQKYPNEKISDELVFDYVLLKKSTISGCNHCEKQEYFLEEGYKHIPGHRNIHALTKMSVLSYELSKLKLVNDTKGHGYTDKQMQQIPLEVNSILENQSSIRSLSPIVQREAKKYYKIIQTPSSEKASGIIEAIENIPSELRINAAIHPLIEKDGISNSSTDFTSLLANCLEKNDEQIEEDTTHLKIQDSASLERYIVETLTFLYHDGYIRNYMQDLAKSKNMSFDLLLKQVIIRSVKDILQDPYKEKKKEKSELKHDFFPLRKLEEKEEEI